MNHDHRPKIKIAASSPHPGTRDEQPYIHQPQAKQRLLWGLLLTGTMMVVEAAGGFFSHSLALLSDAGHMLSHFFALGTSFIAILIASRRASEKFSYGFYRVEVLAALLNGAGLFLVALYIFYEGLHRFIYPETVETFSMFWIALAGLVVNLLTAWILHTIEHKDLNVKSAFFHMLADTASSFGVVFGAILIRKTGWLWVDPLLSMMIAGLIVVWSWGLVRDSVLILLESAPTSIQPKAVLDSLKNSYDEIRDIHEMHIWEITSKMYAFTAHIEVDKIFTLDQCEALRDRINHHLDKNFDITHTNLQFERMLTERP